MKEDSLRQIDKRPRIIREPTVRDKEVYSLSKIPLLGDIPILGRLFRNEISNTEEAELLVFIRTKIIRERE